MKKIILLFTVLCSMSFGQEWKPTVQTSINEPNIDKLDLFTNVSGNHVLIRRTNGNVVYYNFNSSGIIDSSKTTELELDGDFPNITGNANILFALYQESNAIAGFYSDDGGSTWNGIDRFRISINKCNGIDAVYQEGLGGGVHLVWRTIDDGLNYKTYYVRLTHELDWVDFQNITDHSTALIGGNPKITISLNRISVSFNTFSDNAFFYGDAVVREKIGNDWQTPQIVVTGSHNSIDEKIISRDDSLFLFYSRTEQNEEIFTNDLYYKKRSITGTNWSISNLVKPIIHLGGNAFNIAKTNNLFLHTIYSPEVIGQAVGLGYKFYNGQVWSEPFLISEDINEEINRGFTSVSNDLFVIWKKENDNYLRYRQYDAAPLAPQNPQLSTNPSNNRVRVSWSKNQEPDISIYEIWRKVAEMGGNWQLIGTTTNNYFVDNEYYYAPQAGDFTLTYRVRAKDIGNNFSLYSNEVTVRAEYLGKEYLAGNNTEYKLIQNYPNPFNPSTNISYSIKEDGFVTLKVYDILGVEIATLVNEQKTAGSYEADFNAANLPSGMYIYKLHAGSFTDVKKMLLTK